MSLTSQVCFIHWIGTHTSVLFSSFPRFEEQLHGKCEQFRAELNVPGPTFRRLEGDGGDLVKLSLLPHLFVPLFMYISKDTHMLVFLFSRSITPINYFDAQIWLMGVPSNWLFCPVDISPTIL